jgi:phosphate transport system permease protein
MNEQSSRAERQSGEQLMPGPEARRKLRQWRTVKDYFAKGFVATAGVGVIIALATIFIYLFSEVMPLFTGADMDEAVQYEMPGVGESETLYLATERHTAVAVRFTSEGQVIFFEPKEWQCAGNEIAGHPSGCGSHQFCRR